MLLYDGRWDKKPNMVFERSDVDECSLVFIIRNFVADALVSLRCRGLNNLAKLYKFAPWPGWAAAMYASTSFGIFL